MSNNATTRIRKPVKREEAERYLRYTLTSFAAAVIVTRLYLMATGYPQLGGGELHIAHVLWGGLLLFIACLFPLLASNRWVYTMASILAGIGVGLFIDEVGKFLTKNVDYFFAPAAPLIYGFFMLCVLVYIEIRRPPSDDARAELYRALDGMQEVLDHDLTDHERSDLEKRLSHAASIAERDDLKKLAADLLAFVSSNAVATVQEKPGLWQGLMGQIDALEARWLDRRRYRLLIGAGFGFVTVLAALNLVVLLLEVFNPAVAPRATLLLTFTGGVVKSGGPLWFSILVLLRSLVVTLLLLGLVLLFARQERLGIRLGTYGLLLSLTSVNLFVFYFDQFNAIAETLIQFVVLIGAIRYRRRYLSAADIGRGIGASLEKDDSAQMSEMKP